MENAESSVLRLYCHICNIRFENTGNNFICPHCSDGFVEVVEIPERPNSNVVSEDSDDSSSDGDVEVVRIEGSRIYRHWHGTTYRRRLTGTTRSNLRHDELVENSAQNFIVDLNMQVLLENPGNHALRNPRNYASRSWGHEGVDALVIEVLHHEDNASPPPVSKEVIDALPIISVNSDQVDEKLRCTICLENFLLGENVCQLPCAHIYHVDCIRHWLELHGTCPICRQNLINDYHPNDNNQDFSEGGSSRRQNAVRNALQSAFNNTSNNSNLENSRPSHSRDQI